MGSCSRKESKTHEFRGENRSGEYQESELLKEWPAKGPSEVLVLENIGDGYGSPVITDENIYVTGSVDSIATLFCFNLLGEKLWNAEYGVEWTENFPGSRSAPTLVDDLIYVGSGMGNLFCFNANTGEKLWSKDLKEDFEGVIPRFGHSESVLVDEDKVFWVPGGKKYNVVALNRYTGDIMWSNPGFGERSAYNSPVLIEIPDKKIVVTFSAYHLLGLDAETGELLWNHEQDNTPLEKREIGQGDTHSNTVLYEDGAIYYVAGDGNCAVKLALSQDGKEISEVWRNSGFDGYMGGIVKHGNFIYGDATHKKELRSIDATTGTIIDSLKIGSGALITADNMLYYYNHKGQLNLISFNEGKMKVVSSFKIDKGGKEHFAHPVIQDGILYQRHGDVLMAFDIRDNDVEGD